jgi:hypothetical protein
MISTYQLYIIIIIILLKYVHIYVRRFAMNIFLFDRTMT